MRPVEQRLPKKNWRKVPVFADITRKAGAFFEAACNMRDFEQEETCTDDDPNSKTYGQAIDRPATYSAATSESCGACAQPRAAVIGFPADGAWRRVEAATAAIHGGISASVKCSN
jgi:hypothetical protein